MNRRVLVVVALLALAGIVIILSRRSPPTLAPTPPASIPTGVVAAVPAVLPEPSARPVTLRPLTATQPPGTAATTIPAAAGKTESPAAISQQSALETLRVAVRLYGSMFGGNPVGTNVEITRALLGANPKKARLLDDYRLNETGELIDGWGTPYFFHQLSGQETEIRSAGPDRQMWTSDDIVMH